MKRFMCLTFAALLCLVCLLPLRASASSDYDLAYDATDRMDSAFMNQLGTQTFYRLKTPPERNLILYDDIITTGSTILATRELFPEKNIITIVNVCNRGATM